MTTTDWIIDIVLVLVVLRQLREEKFSARVVIIPAAIVAYVAFSYLHAFPTGGDDLLLTGLATALGIALGVAGGLLTRVRRVGGGATIQAGPAAAAVWVVSMTARLGFIIWLTHSGGPTIARFSAAHGITSADAWQTALVLLALSEVVVRIGIITVRALRAAGPAAAPAEVPAVARV